MSSHAAGSFDVRVVPLPPQEIAAAVGVGGMSIDKRFHGDLDATSQGEMLAARTEANGSAVYVALERVTGTLAGRAGSFLLAHTGLATRDGQQLTVSVAADSGTDALAGLTGTMRINIVEGKHFYELDYTLPAAP